jgi:histone acetyltransferase (RNA polymerase elongator complex component)
LKDTPLAELYLEGKYLPLSVEEAVEHCKLLLVMFEKAGIPVIRIGLQPSEQINLTGDVIAGPYHPAFRELVEAAVARDQLEYLLHNQVSITKAQKIEIAVPESDVSVVRGHKSANVEYFREKYGILEFITIPDAVLQPGTLKLLSVDGTVHNRLITRQDLPDTTDTAN